MGQSGLSCNKELLTKKKIVKHASILVKYLDSFVSSKFQSYLTMKNTI